MRRWLQAIAAGIWLALCVAMPAQADLNADWRTCVDLSNPAAGYAACSRLIVSGRMGNMLARGYVMRGIHSSIRKDFDAAAADFSEAIRLAPTANHYADRGGMWMLKGDYSRAVADYDQSIRLKPNDANVHYTRALALGRNGDLTRAIAGFNDAIRLNPACAICHSKSGIVYEKLGDAGRARESFQAALAISDPSQESEQARVTARKRLAQLAPASLRQPPVLGPAATASVSSFAMPATVPPPVSVVARPQGRRVALVIGNSDYRAVPVLPNPRRDAAAVADALRRTGFQSVTLAQDLTRERMIDTLRRFAIESEGADWSLVYFAGHGIEVGGQNYVIPIDARLATDRDAQYEAVQMEQVMGATEGAKRLRLLLLDACRENPFANQMKRVVASRSIGRGQTQVETDAGMLVVFAAKHGQVAFDGDRENSPFASAFVKRLLTPHLEIRKLFDLVRDDVMAATNRRQQPFSYGSVPGNEDFYFLTSAIAEAR